MIGLSCWDAWKGMCRHAGTSLAKHENNQNSDENNTFSIRETGRCSRWRRQAGYIIDYCSPSRAMTDLYARLTTIEEVAGMAGSSSKDISGIESAETEGDRAYSCTCAVRGIFPAVLPWLLPLPWPTPRIRIVVVWQLSRLPRRPDQACVQAL
jgi:hypothetical protein